MTIHIQQARQLLLRQPQVLGSASSGFTNPASESAQRIRKNVALACEECKVKKRRCNGKLPCRFCMDKALCCRFRPESDRRRVRGITKTFSVMSERVSKYERLFNVLRNGASSEAIQALHYLRSSPIESQQEPDYSNDIALDKVLQLVEETNGGKQDLDLRAVFTIDARFSNSAICVSRAVAQLSLYWTFPVFCPNM
jgi:hypothetical protein